MILALEEVELASAAADRRRSVLGAGMMNFAPATIEDAVAPLVDLRRKNRFSATCRWQTAIEEAPLLARTP
jgi:hypothetical protein